MKLSRAFTSCFKQALSSLTSGLQEEVQVGKRRIKLVRLLGEGGYSFVYLGVDCETGQEYAVKKILAQSSEQLELAKKEIQVMGRFRHPNLLALVDSEAKRGQEGKEMGKNVVYLVFRAYKDGTVVDLVEKSQRIHPAVVLNIFLQVCRGEDSAPRATVAPVSDSDMADAPSHAVPRLLSLYQAASTCTARRAARVGTRTGT